MLHATCALFANRLKGVVKNKVKLNKLLILKNLLSKLSNHKGSRFCIFGKEQNVCCHNSGTPCTIQETKLNT